MGLTSGGAQEKVVGCPGKGGAYRGTDEIYRETDAMQRQLRRGYVHVQMRDEGGESMGAMDG